MSEAICERCIKLTPLSEMTIDPLGGWGDRLICRWCRWPSKKHDGTHKDSEVGE